MKIKEIQEKLAVLDARIDELEDEIWIDFRRMAGHKRSINRLKQEKRELCNQVMREASTDKFLEFINKYF